ncbi:MAG: N-acetyltransferase [Microbacteriaceae bacterium]|nr:N-acetyltransferase [Cryobacterium sp.]MBX3103501.1 N-acetyltransferase [Cryobacterium sp.]MCC6375429.1 N-acetyltransferase [Microbacteriaceae bacterium]
MTKELRNETESNRYTLRIDGEIASAVDYKTSGESVSFTHTFTDPKRRGQGLAAEIVEFAVDDVEQNSSRKIIPMCWYVGEWFDKHPERANLLTR